MLIVLKKPMITFGYGVDLKLESKLIIFLKSKKGFGIELKLNLKLRFFKGIMTRIVD